MGFAELLEAIEVKGKNEKDKVISRSEKTAKRLIEEAEAKAEEITQSILQEEDPELEVTKTRILGESELKKKRALTQAKNQILQEVFEEARRILAGIRDRNDYESILRKLGEEVLCGEDLIAYVDKRDVQLMQRIVASSGRKADVRSGADCLGGVVVEGKNSSVSIHNTIESRLEKVREPLIQDVNQILFRGE